METRCVLCEVRNESLYETAGNNLRNLRCFFEIELCNLTPVGSAQKFLRRFIVDYMQSQKFIVDNKGPISAVVTKSAISESM
jgi:hypothetical protein